MRWILCLTAAALALAGCSSTCKQACDNAAQVCAATFAAEGTTFDANNCADSCNNNLDGCKNMGEQEDCVLAAKTCEDLQKCPACSQ
jgi:hypothetical protein